MVWKAKAKPLRSATSFQREHRNATIACVLNSAQGSLAASLIGHAWAQVVVAASSSKSRHVAIRIRLLKLQQLTNVSGPLLCTKLPRRSLFTQQSHDQHTNKRDFLRGWRHCGDPCVVLPLSKASTSTIPPTCRRDGDAIAFSCHVDRWRFLPHGHTAFVESRFQ